MEDRQGRGRSPLDRAGHDKQRANPTLSPCKQGKIMDWLEDPHAAVPLHLLLGLQGDVVPPRSSAGQGMILYQAHCLALEGPSVGRDTFGPVVADALLDARLPSARPHERGDAAPKSQRSGNHEGRAAPVGSDGRSQHRSSQ